MKLAKATGSLQTLHSQTLQMDPNITVKAQWCFAAQRRLAEDPKTWSEVSWSLSLFPINAGTKQTPLNVLELC